MADTTPTTPRPSRLPLIAVCVAAGAYVATFGTMGILQYVAGNITYIDTANFEEMLWRTLHGEFLMSSQWPYNFLGRHVQFIHLALLPVYAIVPDLRTLMLAQTVALAAGAFPLYALARHVLRNRWAGVALAVAYLLYTPLQMLNLEGGGAYNTFRPINFAVVLLLAGFYCLVRQRLVWFSVLAVLTLACKEEFGLILVMLGIYAAAFQRRRVFGPAWSVVGLAWFVVSVWVVMRGVSGGSTSHTITYYSHLGSTWGEVLSTVVLRPFNTLRVMFAPEKLEFFTVMLLPVGFLCLLDLPSLLVALPVFGLCLLSKRYASWMPWFHYHAPIVPFVFIATVYGVRNLGWLVRRVGKGHDERAAGRVTAFAAAFVLLCALGTNVVYSKSPLSFRFYDPKSPSYYRDLYVVSPRARKFPEVVRAVPRDAVVSASLFLATYFTHHAAVLPFPGGMQEGHWRPATHVVIDLGERWLRDSPDQHARIEALLASPDFERLPAPDGFLILRRRHTGG